MVDLHMHSCYSDDGEFSPKELVQQCFDNQIHIMSITDHNTVRGTDEALIEAKSKGIDYIPGIEIDCVFQDTNFHVLGYGIDYKSIDFEAIERNVDEQSLQASLDMLAKTQALGFKITENHMKEVSKNSYYPERWTGEMFAEVLLNMPEYKNHSLLEDYRQDGLRSDNPYVNFYWDFYSQGKPCYVKIEYPKMEEVIDIIHQNCGIAVLAHPGVNLKGKESMIPFISKLGIDGIEALSSYHTLEVTDYYYQQSLELGKYVTCGSDFHGKIKPSINLGDFKYSSIFDMSKVDDTVKMLLNNKY